jgi:hypothetical protein
MTMTIRKGLSEAAEAAADRVLSGNKENGQFGYAGATYLLTTVEAAPEEGTFYGSIERAGKTFSVYLLPAQPECT